MINYNDVSIFRQPIKFKSTFRGHFCAALVARISNQKHCSKNYYQTSLSIYIFGTNITHYNDRRNKITFSDSTATFLCRKWK